MPRKREMRNGKTKTRFNGTRTWKRYTTFSVTGLPNPFFHIFLSLSLSLSLSISLPQLLHLSISLYFKTFPSCIISVFTPLQAERAAREDAKLEKMLADDVCRHVPHLPYPSQQCSPIHNDHLFWFFYCFVIIIIIASKMFLIHQRIPTPKSPRKSPRKIHLSRSPRSHSSALTRLSLVRKLLYFSLHLLLTPMHSGGHGQDAHRSIPL